MELQLQQAAEQQQPAVVQKQPAAEEQQQPAVEEPQPAVEQEQQAMVHEPPAAAGFVDELDDGLARLNDLDLTWGFDLDAFLEERAQQAPAAGDADALALMAGGPAADKKKGS